MEIPSSVQINLYGVFIEVAATGVLITGAHAQGKSELALNLIHRGHRFIADDIVNVTRSSDGHLYGTCPSLTQDFLTIHNLGTINLRKLFGDNAICQSKQVEIIINLDFNQDNTENSLLLGSQTTRNIQDIDIPEWAIQNGKERNLSLLVETIVKIYHQQQAGYHAGNEIIQRQQLLLNNL